MLEQLPNRGGARYPMLVARTMLAIVCFAIAIVLTVAPGPAFVFWALGFVLLGFSVGQMLLSVVAFQDFLRRRVPYADRLPRMSQRQIRAILRQHWVRSLDRLSAQRERRREARAARRAARAKRKRGG